MTETAPSEERSGFPRRSMLLGLAALGAVPLLSPTAAAAAGVSDSAALDGTFSPLRPPATPLAVRSMYLSTWQASDNLAGSWSSFWNGRTAALCGIARIDGKAYLFAGSPSLAGLTTMQQTSLQVTSTRSIYTLTGGGITLKVTFFSPVDPADVQRQSVPFSYVTVNAVSSDGGTHQVSVYLDISAEWAHGDNAQRVRWAQQQTGATTALTFTPDTPTVLAENNELASWGSVVLAGNTRAGLTWQIGQDTVVRGNAATNGTLPGTVDTNQPRAISDQWPVLGLNQNLGGVGTTAQEFTVHIGHVRTPAVTYQGTQLNPWWTHYWSAWPAMLDWFSRDYATALSRSTSLDNRVSSEASAAVGGGTVGTRYAAICALAVRQAVAGTELVDRGGSPWAFLKEISSNGNMSTVDVIYPAFPAYLYLSPSYLRLLLEPVLDCAEHGIWNARYAEHDLGTHYPNATGHREGEEESMPVEESANMLIMSAALAQRLPAAEATTFVQTHYAILKQWADYLVEFALDPNLQNQTDDFTGFIAHSVNLALKGIVGIGAMSIVAAKAGNTADATHYLSTSRSYISQWFDKAQDTTGDHLKLAYDQPGTWSLKYNGYPDLLLGLDLVPEAVSYQESRWYQARAGQHGVLLDPRNDYTKGDWEIWTAAWLSRYPARDALINGVYNFANETTSRVPFTDWYVVASATQRGFAARPVIGGMLALLPAAAASGAGWARIQNKNSGKVLAVNVQSLANSAEVTQYDDNGTPDHLWAVVPSGDGTVRIVNRHSGKVLAVNVQSTADGAHVQQYVDNGTPDHDWRIVDAGGGWSKIVNNRSGKVLAVDQASTANGAQVTQYTDNGTSDHLWRFVR